MRNEDTCHMDWARPREFTKLLNICCFDESLMAFGRRNEGGWVSPILLAYHMSSFDWVSHVP